jgi:predicted DNA-binding protein (UPF0251 family)
MPEKIKNKEIDKQPAPWDISPTPPSIHKPTPVELELDEADALFHKRTEL